MKISVRSLGLIGLLGGLGGALAWSGSDMLRNGITGWFEWLFKDPRSAEPSWVITVVGATQGALLALLSAGWVARLSRYQPVVRWVGAPLVGWSSGWVSYIPVEFYFGTEATAVDNVREAIFWPFRVDVGFSFPVQPLYGFLAPFFAFGFVALLFHVLYSYDRSRRMKLWWNVLVGFLSGLIGPVFVGGFTKYSLLFGVLYGTSWGSLVGFGVWKSQQATRH
jgi:hypothetical protein